MTNELNKLLEIEPADAPTNISGTVVYLLSLPIVLTLGYLAFIALLSQFGSFAHTTETALWVGGLSSFIAAGISGIYGIINWSLLSIRQKVIVVVQALLFVSVLAWVAFLAFVLLTGKPLFSKM